MKKTLYFIVIIIVGALIGTFIGKLVAIMFPQQAAIKDLFATEMATGLHPVTLDLFVITLTFGCLFKINITGIMGIAAAALLSKPLFK